jgi:histidine ammonia-lyase
MLRSMHEADGSPVAALPVVTLDGRSLTPSDVVQIARGRAEARIGEDARERNAAARRLVGELLDRGDLLYGVTTGVGALRSEPAELEDPGDFQWRLLRSHAGGGGAPLRVEEVRAAMAVRANQIGAGGAGVGDALLDAIEAALRAGVTPFARELGSLGTGDLTVLAEIGVALGGEGDCWVGDDVVPAADALAAYGLAPVRYAARDGIGFMSSNAVSTGQAALVFHDASRLLDSALSAAALSFEAAGADLSVLDPRVHAARPHAGQIEVARRLRRLLDFDAQRSAPARRRVHDSFVFRCVPQVEGTLLDALDRLARVLDIELNVAGENALLLPRDGVALPNGNFHAGVLTLALDALRGAMAQSASLVAARVSALLDPAVTGLTPELAQDPGPDSGAMILEYTAHAAAAEVRSLAATAASQTTSVQSGIESHASFAGHSARRTSDALARMAVAVSAELVLAVRALRLRGRPPEGPGVRGLFDAAAARLDPSMSDRPLSGDLEAARQLLFDDSLWLGEEG